MKNTVFYGFQFPHHGRFSGFLALSAEMRKNGIRVCKIRFPEIPLWVPGRIRGPLAKKWYEANEYRLKAAFDAGHTVHYFFPENSLFRAAEWKRIGALILSCHQPVAQLMAIKKAQKLFSGMRASSAVVLMASSEIDAYKEFAPDSKVVCIPHGVDTEFFSPDRKEQDSGGRIRILTVGNWLRDYDLWAKVVVQTVAKCPDVEFSVLADHNRLAAATSTLKAEWEYVSILEGISDEQLRDEYRRADIIFLPLIDAWANNALLEGMACGRAVVATDLPAVREYAGDSARFVEKGSVDAAVTEILRLSTADEERIALGEKARQRMISWFSWRRITRQYLELYADLA